MFTVIKRPWLRGAGESRDVENGLFWKADLLSKIRNTRISTEERKFWVRKCGEYRNQVNGDEDGTNSRRLLFCWTLLLSVVTCSRSSGPQFFRHCCGRKHRPVLFRSAP